MANGHGGRRPGSGQKPLSEKINRIADINKCLDVYMEFVTSDAPLKERAEMAKHIAAKAIPQDINMSGEMTHNFFILDAIAKSTV